jgi:hypothetical protein
VQLHQNLSARQQLGVTKQVLFVVVQQGFLPGNRCHYVADRVVPMYVAQQGVLATPET